MPTWKEPRFRTRVSSLMRSPGPSRILRRVPVTRQPETVQALARGRALFNAGRFWEAHETWEEAWRVEHGPIRLLLHGLIQVAAGCHHVVVTHRAAGAVKLLGSGLEKLETVPDGLVGFALDAFRTDVVRLLELSRSWMRGDCDAVEASRLPRLELQ
jgi:hypothetical protein